MVLNEEGSVFRKILCLKEECLDTTNKYIVTSDGSRSDDACEDIIDLLPNDPFSMEYNLAFPSDPFGMDMDVHKCLPKDPFDMNFKLETYFGDVTDWIDDFRLTSCEFERGEAYEESIVDYNKYYAEVNLVWASSMKFDEVKGDKGEIVVAGNGLPMDYNNMLGENTMDLMCFGCEKYQKEELKIPKDSIEGEPNDALFFALGYLELKDLLSVEMVCKSLCGAVQNDPLLWRSIYIKDPWNYAITDDNLIRLTNRAQGTLHTLSIQRCLKITNSSLKHILETNPRLTKLSATGCIRLDLKCLLYDIKVFNSIAKPGMKHLRIGETRSTTNELLDEFKFILGTVDEDKKCSNYKPRFHREGEISLSLDDERAIDIDKCPQCQQVRQVYDCPVDSCQVKPGAIQTCRGCTICIARCMKCGCCFKNKDYEETLGYDLICLDCFGELLNCKEDRMSFSLQIAYCYNYV